MPSHSIDDEEFSASKLDELLIWISTQTGLSFRSQRGRAMEILCREIGSSHTRDVEAFRKRISIDQAAFDDLVGELTIGETYFFRDEDQFQIIASDFLQEMARSRPANHLIRVWSAGCASGEEAWSVAITLAESGLEHRSHVLATDISRLSLNRARAGRYRPWSLRGAAKRRMHKWIEEQEDTYLIHHRLREHVSFEYLNLAQDNYPSFATNTVGLDMIICRNVLIYFDSATIESVANRFYRCLSPGGWLITGASDPLLSKYAPFETRVTPHGLICRRADSESSGADRSDSQSLSSPGGSKEASGNRKRSPQPLTATRPSAPRQMAKQEAADTVALNQISQRIRSASDALAAGRYEEVLRLTSSSDTNTQLCVLRVRALANVDVERAAEFCSTASHRHPTSKELHYLYAVLLTEAGRYPAAMAAARRVVFLDRELVVGHMALGAVSLRTGDLITARRSFRNAERLCRARPSEEIVPLSDGEHCGRMAESAARQMAMVDDTR